MTCTNEVEKEGGMNSNVIQNICVNTGYCL